MNEPSGTTRWVGLALLAAFFASILLPEWFPELATTDGALAYVIALAGVTVALLLGLLMTIILVVVDRSEGRHPHRTLRAGISFCASGLVILIAMNVCLQFVRGDLPAGSYARTFDAVQWAATDTDDGDRINPRHTMLGDLIDHVLPGRSRADVRALLGPESGRWVDEGDIAFYELGHRPGVLFGNYEFLFIHFDANERVARIELRFD